MRKSTKKILPFIFFFLISFCVTPLLTNVVNAQEEDVGEYSIGFSSLITPILTGFYDYDTSTLINPQTDPAQIATFLGDFPKFRVSTSDVTPLEVIDLGIRVVPYEFDNGTQTQVRAFVKDFVLGYSMQIETLMTDGDFVLSRYDRVVPLYKLWRYYFGLGNVHQSPYDLNVKIPDTQYVSDYVAKAVDVAQGEIYIDYVIDPTNAFPSGEEDLAFIQNFQTDLGGYNYLDYWIGAVHSEVGEVLSNGFVDEHTIEIDIDELQDEQDYNIVLQNFPTGGGAHVSYYGVTNAFNNTINGGVLGLPSENTGLTLSRPENEDELYNPSSFNNIMYNGQLLGIDNLQMRARYPIEIAPRINQFYVDHGINGLQEYQTDPDGLLPFFGWQTTTNLPYGSIERANLGIVVANRFATVQNNVTVRIVSFYDFDPYLPENEYQNDPFGNTGDIAINPSGWGIQDADIIHYDIYGAMWGSIITIIVLIVVLYVVVKIVQSQTKKSATSSDPEGKKSKFQKYKWLIYAGVIVGAIIAILIVLSLTGILGIFF